MIASTTLPAVSLRTTANTNHKTSTSTNKRVRENPIVSSETKKSTFNPQSNEIDNSSIRDISTFRIPKKVRPNGNIPSEMTESMSQISNTKSNSPSNPQSGKRKFSLSQYKEHKRSKANDAIQNCSADVDMRVHDMENPRNSPPTSMDSDSSNQAVLNSETNHISKDVILKSNLSAPGIKKAIKKKLVWADDRNQALVQTSFFEIDESELVDIHAFARQCAANLSIAQLEKLMERDVRQRQHFSEMNAFDNDDRQNLPPLPKLIPILLPDTIHSPIVQSQERLVQEEREKTVLRAFSMPSFVVDSPGEPDGDRMANNNHEARTIPFDDKKSSSKVNEESSVNDADSTPKNASTLSLSTLEKLSPQVAQIFAQAKENASSATGNNPPPTVNVNTSINQINSLPSINPNLASASNLFSALLNMARSNGMETSNVPPTNPIVNLTPNGNLNIVPLAAIPIDQLAARAISLGLLPPPTTNFNSPVFQPAPINSASNPPPMRFVSPPNQRPSSRFNQTNSEYRHNGPRGNARGRVHRRGLHNNNHQRRGFHQNRNTNRNVFS